MRKKLTEKAGFTEFLKYWRREFYVVFFRWPWKYNPFFRHHFTDVNQNLHIFNTTKQVFFKIKMKLEMHIRKNHDIAKCVSHNTSIEPALNVRGRG